jgi:hypothetical protein
VALGPAQIHAQEHLGPVGRLGATRAGADREQRRTLVVLAREQQGRPLTREVLLEAGRVAVELGFQLGIGRLGKQVDRRQQVVDATEQPLPQGSLLTQAVSLAKDLLRGALIVPEARFLGQRVKLSDAVAFCREVKASPRSLGSARRGRGWRRRPPSSGPEDPGAGSA